MLTTVHANTVIDGKKRVIIIEEFYPKKGNKSDYLSSQTLLNKIYKF